MGLAERLKQLRLNAEISQLKLADETGLSVHSINSYESGRREPNSKAMAVLEDFFGVTGAYLRGEKEEVAIVTLALNPEHMVFTPHPPCVQEAVQLIYEAGYSEQVMYNSLVKSFSKLTRSGQKEILKRIEEYRDMENARGNKAPSSKESVG